MDEKRKKKAFCYNCDEKWNPAHVCKNSIVYLLKVQNSVISRSKVKSCNEEVQIVEDELVEKSNWLEISLHAILGYSTNNAIN